MQYGPISFVGEVVAEAQWVDASARRVMWEGKAGHCALVLFKMLNILVT